MKILVTTPTYEGVVKAGMHDAAANLERGGHDVRFRTVKGYVCDRARTLMAKAAVGGGYDWALFVDSDVAVPPDALVNMLEHGVDVCLGYYRRQGAPEGVTCLEGEGGPYSGAKLAALRGAGTDLVAVKRGGLGCALIRVDVFARIGEPWFRYATNPDGSPLSEDFWFCRQCRRAGIGVFADTRVACGHYSRQLLEVL